MSAARTAKRTRPTRFVKGFKPWTAEELHAAAGKFPWDIEERKRNRETSLLSDAKGRTGVASFDQLDNFCYYSNVDVKGHPIWPRLPEPADDACWLATVREPGQTFNEYVKFVSHRSGRFAPGTNAGKPIVYLLPITTLKGTEIQPWPEDGPDLKLLGKWVEAFYDRDVVILDPASMSVAETGIVLPGQKKTFAPRYEDECKVRFRTATYESYIEGRVSPRNGHWQTHVEGLLSEIQLIRQEGIHTYSADEQITPFTAGEKSGIDVLQQPVVIDLTADEAEAPSPEDASSPASGNPPQLGPTQKGATPARAIHDAFAVIGITMEDIYSAPGDLFIAGMAAGGSKVAVLSFARYHPRLRMHFQDWDDYGYASKSAEYSYFEEGKPRPKVSDERSVALDAESRANYLRRAGKVVVHELAHVYGIDHCIHYHCVMNGTGHLVEDFSAPAHLCAVCLRKLQFRMGFDVPQRYQRLLSVFKAGGLTKEARWVERRLANLPSAVPVSPAGDPSIA
jgi:predicted Zn-dependent protease